MPSRLKLTAAAVVASGVAGGAVLALTLAGALAACIDGDGLDLERPAAQDATTLREASTPMPDAATHPVDASCSPDLATDPLNCGACGHVCTLPVSLDGGSSDAGADGAADGSADSGSSPDTNGSTVAAACVASVCTVGCTAGHADCNGSLADGCEVTVLTDPRNCGACGVTCGSQACDAGACPYGVLVEDGGVFTEIAVNDASVFAGVTSPVSGIVELPKDGGAAPALLCHGAPTAGLVVDPAGHVTFADPAATAIEQAPLVVPAEAGAPTALYASTDPRVLTYGSGPLVWSQAYNDGNLDAPSVSGIFTAGALVVSSTSYVRNVAATTTAVLFAGQNWIASPPAVPALSPPEDVYVCALPACGTAGAIAGAQYRVYDLTTDGKNVFWTSWGLGEKAGFLSGCSLAGCTPAALLSGLAQPEAVVSDGSTVYWYELGLQAIRALKIPAAGADAGVPTTVASGVVGVTNLVLDPAYIYWDQPPLGEIDRAHR